MSEIRKCKGCGVEFEAKDCRQLYHSKACQWRFNGRLYHQRHVEEARDYRLANRQKIKEYASNYNKMYRARNLEELKEKHRKYYLEHIKPNYPINRERLKQYQQLRRGNAARRIFLQESGWPKDLGLFKVAILNLVATALSPLSTKAIEQILVADFASRPTCVMKSLCQRGLLLKIPGACLATTTRRAGERPLKVAGYILGPVALSILEARKK